MTQEIYIEDIANILKSKSKIERQLKVKIEPKGRLFFIDGSAENEYLGLKVLEAMGLGFSIDKALLLKDENNLLHVLNIKDITKRNDLERVRARIIGTKGKTIGNIAKLSNCHISLKDNNIGIIGDTENIDEGILAVKSLIHGSKQGNVYARLEKETKKKRQDPTYNEDIKNELELKHKKNHY